MAPEINVPDYTYKQIQEQARAFLKQHNPSTTIPVPIEEIAEVRLEMDIIPVPGLLKTLDVDGFISSDFRSVTVDEFIYLNRVTRYRFTLAHELAHRFLHRDVYSAFHFDRIEKWVAFQESVGEREYALMEGHANVFAGLVLVPPVVLAEQYGAAAKKAASAGIDVSRRRDITLPYVARAISSAFGVSPEVIRIRIERDKL